MGILAPISTITWGVKIVPKNENLTKRFKTRSLGPIVAGTIQSFSVGRRNAVRGIVAEAQRRDLHSAQINSIRDNLDESDMVASATILDSPGGLRKRAVVGLKQGDIDHPHHLIARSASLEAA